MRRRIGERRPRTSGVSMVEFALVAPLLFLVLLGLVVLGVVVMNQIALNNAVRDGVRAAAVCGSQASSSFGGTPTTKLPDGSPCSSLNAYLTKLLGSVHGGVTFTAPTVVNPLNGTTYGDLSYCGTVNGASGVGTFQVKLHATYAQALYVPLVGHVLGNNGSTSTRTLTADAEATCEQ